MRGMLAIMMMVLLGVPALAHVPLMQVPLVGPLIAADTAQQDRILLYDLSNMTRRDLSFGPYAQRAWDFSANGCRVLFTMDSGNGLMKLYSARLDGTDMQEMVRYSELPPGNWGVWEPQWSPDGSRIAFTMIRDQPQLDGSTEREYHIAWISAEGGEPQFYSVTGDEHEPRWSPDGRWLAYLGFVERVAGADIQSTAEPTAVVPAGQPTPQHPMLNEAELWVVSADGATKYRLTSFATGSVRGPRWSPDGELIGFTYSPSPNNDQFYMIANQPESIATQLSAEWSLVLDTTWLPDSTAMIAAVRDFQGTPENWLWQIPLVGLADTDAVPYLVNRDLGYADYPRFSPDGQWLAFRSAYALALVDTSNQAWALLDEQTPGNTPPVWSPPGFAGEGSC